MRRLVLALAVLVTVGLPADGATGSDAGAATAHRLVGSHDLRTTVETPRRAVGRGTLVIDTSNRATGALKGFASDVPRSKRGMVRGSTITMRVVNEFGVASDTTNPIQAENTQKGTTAWQTPDEDGPAIEGYASEVSALAGDTIHLHVSTKPASRYRIEVYRLGWYGGAGGRLLACIPTDCADSLDGQPQAAGDPGAGGIVQAGWPVTDTLTIPSAWTTGYLMIRFRLPSGQAATTYVVLRDPPDRHSTILVQVPVNTWQAYNGWGGMSLYEFDYSAPAPRATTCPSTVPTRGTSRAARARWSGRSRPSASSSGGLRRLVPDGRRHAARSELASPAPARPRQRPRRVLDEGDVRRVRWGARPRGRTSPSWARTTRTGRCATPMPSGRSSRTSRSPTRSPIRRSRPSGSGN